jgi:hypothetical protein
LVSVVQAGTVPPVPAVPEPLAPAVPEPLAPAVPEPLAPAVPEPLAPAVALVPAELPEPAAAGDASDELEQPCAAYANASAKMVPDTVKYDCFIRELSLVFPAWRGSGAICVPTDRPRMREGGQIDHFGPQRREERGPGP